MKTFLKLLIVLAAALAIPACGGNSPSPKYPTSPGGQPGPSGPTP